VDAILGTHRVDPGVMQDLPDRGGSDLVAEFDEFARHSRSVGW
jgi:hypothetical protein